MEETIREVTLIMRRWDKESGLTEHTRAYPSLAALYSACLHVGDVDLVDRLIIRGSDDAGHERVVTFVFQSVTVSGTR